MKTLRAHDRHRPAAVGQPRCFREAAEAGRASSRRQLTLSKQDVLQVEHGSLYPALHRLQNRGWIASFWGTSENNRKARCYRLTAPGKKQLVEQSSRWDQLVRAIGRIMKPDATFMFYRRQAWAHDAC